MDKNKKRDSLCSRAWSHCVYSLFVCISLARYLFAVAAQDDEAPKRPSRNHYLSCLMPKTNTCKRLCISRDTRPLPYRTASGANTVPKKREDRGLPTDQSDAQRRPWQRSPDQVTAHVVGQVPLAICFAMRLTNTVDHQRQLYRERRCRTLARA